MSVQRARWVGAVLCAAAGVGGVCGEAATNSSTASVVKEIVVTGTRLETESYRVPADVTALEEPALHKPGVANYQQALGSLPGVKTHGRQENDIATPAIEVRGLESNPTSGGNLMILLDGIPQRRLSFGGPYVGALPSDAITRLELVKGPAASLYGRGALGGALQLFTSPGTEDWGGGAWVSYESEVEQLRAALRASGPLAPGGAATFSLTGSRTETEGWQPRTEGSRSDLYLHTRALLGDRDTLDVMAGYVDAEREMAAPVLIDANGKRLDGIARDANLSVPGQNSGAITEYRLASVWDHAFADTLDGKLTAAYWAADTSWRVGRPDDRPASGTVVNRASSNREWEEGSWFGEYQMTWRYEVGRGVSGSLIGGASLEDWSYRNNFQSIWSPGSDAARGILLDLSNPVEPDPASWIYGPWTLGKTKETDYGGFLRNRNSFGDRVDVECGARFDGYERKQRNLTSGASAEVTGHALSPSVGAAWHVLPSAPEAATVYASWGQGFFPVYRGVGKIELVEIPPERSTGYELGLKSALLGGRVRTGIAWYRQERNDVVGTDPATGQPDNIGDWRIQGVEASVEARVVGNLTLYASYTYREPEIARDASAPATEGNEIPFVARSLATVGAGYLPASGIQARVEARHVGDSFVNAANTTTLPAYELVEASVGYAWKAVTVSVFGRNLLDEEYYSAVFNGVKNGSAFEGMPRSFGVSVAAAF